MLVEIVLIVSLYDRWISIFFFAVYLGVFDITFIIDYHDLFFALEPLCESCASTRDTVILQSARRGGFTLLGREGTAGLFWQIDRSREWGGRLSLPTRQVG